MKILGFGSDNKEQGIKADLDLTKDYIMPSKEDFKGFKSLSLVKVLSQLLVTSSLTTEGFTSLNSFYKDFVEKIDEYEFCDLMNDSIAWLVEVDEATIITVLSFAKDPNGIKLSKESIATLNPYLMIALVTKILLAFIENIDVFFYKKPKE